MPGFSLYRRDRQDGHEHGSVVCYIKYTIPVKEWPELNEECIEVLWLTIRPYRLPRQLSHITIGTIYYPPQANDVMMSGYLIESLDTILRNHPHSGVMLCGDFNHLNNRYLTNVHNLTPCVKTPTRGPAVLDLIYTNMQCFYGLPMIYPSIGLSDHMAVIAKRASLPTMSSLPSRRALLGRWLSSES